MCEFNAKMKEQQAKDARNIFDRGDCSCFVNAVPNDFVIFVEYRAHSRLTECALRCH